MWFSGEDRLRKGPKEMEEQKQAERQWNKIRRERINILKGESVAGSHGISGLSIQNSNGAAVSIYTENRQKRRMDKRVMDRPQRKEQKSVVEQRGTGI